MRAWIEILPSATYTHPPLVALFMRAWIEIPERAVIVGAVAVALFMRAWIEIYVRHSTCMSDCSRPLHEGVD